MNLLHHKRLISLYDAYETPKNMIVIMELVTGGELFEKIVEDDNLSEKQVIRYMRQVLYGVQHMHQKNMVHLDLKVSGTALSPFFFLWNDFNDWHALKPVAH